MRTGAPDLNAIYQDAIALLSKLISIPSISGSENGTAEALEDFLNGKGVHATRRNNNLWCFNKYYDEGKPTILLISHHDTVQPNEHYNRNPFEPSIENDKLFGLGSNDAGGSMVSLIGTFLYFFEREDLAFNLCLALTAEEETSGELGIRCITGDLKGISFAIVGEPTGMQLAVAEKGSMVIDCVCKGRSGHAAREEGDNAIYRAFKDIEWFRTFHFPIMENQPEPVKMSVTEIKAGIQHNIVPPACHFTVDIRFDHNYTPREIINTIINHTASDFRVRPNISGPSSIDLTHPLLAAGHAMGKRPYLSPTSSDQAWLDMPSVKIGPGDPARCHTADEYIGIEEIEDGINVYIGILESLELASEKFKPGVESLRQCDRL